MEGVVLDHYCTEKSLIVQKNYLVIKVFIKNIYPEFSFPNPNILTNRQINPATIFSTHNWKKFTIRPLYIVYIVYIGISRAC
jgi:hypothetical protein